MGSAWLYPTRLAVADRDAKFQDWVEREMTHKWAFRDEVNAAHDAMVRAKSKKPEDVVFLKQSKKDEEGTFWRKSRSFHKRYRGNST